MRNILIGKIIGLLLPFVIWASISIFKTTASLGSVGQQASYAKGGYAGSEACKACHEDQFANFSRTPHAKLARLDSWWGKVTGCEQCHGPGQAHIDSGGDKSKIISFKCLTPKAISDICLKCHAGRDEHNNFRRGE